MKQKLFVAIPSGDFLHVRVIHSLVKLILAFKGINLEFGFGSGITNARNSLCMNFINSNFTHMLFIDSDIVFHPLHVKQLLRALVLPYVDIVGGFYPKKQPGTPHPVCVAIEEKPEPDENGLMELRRIGTGFLMFKKQVLLKVMEKFPQHHYTRDSGHKLYDFFTMGVVDHKYVSEDWYFCDRARAAGFKIHGDVSVTLGHVGSTVYSLVSDEAQAQTQGK